MNWRSLFSGSWRNALFGAGIALVVGLAGLKWGDPIFHLGYDLLFFFPQDRRVDEVVVIYMDDTSLSRLKQRTVPEWDRDLHARLVDRLTRDQARMVVFDVVFSEPGTAAANSNLVRAIRANGRVVLAAALDSNARDQIKSNHPVLPQNELLEAAAGWGIAKILGEATTVARQYFAGTTFRPSLPWAIALLARAPVTPTADGAEPVTWLNYYGKADTLPHHNYSEVEDQLPGYYRDKIVFVGARPATLRVGEQIDLFRIPHTLWTLKRAPGVEVTATAALNLLRNDGLLLCSLAKQHLLILAAGLVFGTVLPLLRPLAATGLAAISAVGLLVVALTVANRQHVWFPWTIVAFAQLPAALGWSLRCHYARLSREKEMLDWKLLETSRRDAAVAAAERAAKAAQPALAIPDHTLVRRVGQGAYGEVWLALNAIGTYHAVKVVHRRGFPADAPYEREFRGIQKFMPISRSHPGFVHILHAGRNDAGGFFYYIMEVGDDEAAGQEFDPQTYRPRTLASELERRGMLPPKEVLQLGLSLTLALDYLHRQQLIHRDIKPANLIYVRDEPKFADIGLVTDLGGAAGRDVSYLGTEGYIAPEGPGGAAADVYALGKVLYEAATGRDRRLFPELPTAVLEQPGDGLAQRLNAVIFRACETRLEDRYPTAWAMHEALQQLLEPGTAGRAERG